MFKKLKFIIKITLLLLLLLLLDCTSKKYINGGKNDDYYFNIIQKTNLDNKLLVSTTIFIKDINLISENKYVSGLNKLYKWCLKNDYVLRIYFDENIESYIKKKYLNKSNIELYKYYFPKFYLKNEKIHYGTFGSLVRFFPLFNIKEHYHNSVLVSDCDFDNFLKSTDEDIINFANTNKHLYNKIFMSKSKYCYGTYYRFKNVYNNMFPLMAGCLYSCNNKFDINILDDYLNKLEVNNAIYGCDEYFLNDNLFKKFNNNINIFCYIRQFGQNLCLSQREKGINKENYNQKEIIFSKCNNIFNDYIKHNKNINIEDIKENINTINKIQKIHKLNDSELVYIKCIYYNHFYSKNYNFIINKLFFINDTLYNSLYMTHTKNNNINYYIPTIYDKKINIELKHIYNLKHPLIIINYIKHNYNFKDICSILGDLKIKVRYGDYANINNVLNKKRQFYKTTLLDYYNSIDSFDKSKPDYAGNNILNKTYLEKLKINELKQFYEKFNSCKLWIGLNKSITPLHKDSQRNFSLQLWGKKKWIIYSKNDIPNLCYKNNDAKLEWSNYTIDRYDTCLNSQNSIKFECIINRNDLLYLPKQWSHQVENINKSIMINFWFNSPKF